MNEQENSLDVSSPEEITMKSIRKFKLGYVIGSLGLASSVASEAIAIKAGIDGEVAKATLIGLSGLCFGAFGLGHIAIEKPSKYSGLE